MQYPGSKSCVSRKASALARRMAYLIRSLLRGIRHSMTPLPPVQRRGVYRVNILIPRLISFPYVVQPGVTPPGAVSSD